MGQGVNVVFLSAVWTRFKSGDQEAFAILYNLHIDKLYSYGTKLCKDENIVKDALQELFLELFLKREKIKIASENLKFYLLLALNGHLRGTVHHLTVYFILWVGSLIGHVHITRILCIFVLVRTERRSIQRIER